MNKGQICIVIPIYKETLNEYEVISVKQCINILSDYQIHFICPQGLNLEFYKLNFPQITEFRFFDLKYFKDLFAYNMLMLSPSFYKTFLDFEYMLLYQTDCYVFKDELLNWASKGYDYIGGIWFENFKGNPNTGAKMWFPGNGGLSLRNIPNISKILNSKASLGFKGLQREKKLLKEHHKYNFFKWIFRLPLRLLGYKNNFNYLSKINKINEDVFFMEASLRFNKLVSPTVEEAISFSWDRYPEYLYNLHGKLPFACHAWYREDKPYETNKKFWLSKISI